MESGPSLLEQLSPLRDTRTVILGVGNLLKGDDGAGVLICERLVDEVSATVIDAGTVPENYIGPVVEAVPKNLIILDAADFGDRPGTVRLFELNQIPSVAFSTHTLSPHLFGDLLRRRIEVAIYFIGIQPAHTELGRPVSAPVLQSIEMLTDLFAQLFPAGP